MIRAGRWLYAHSATLAHLAILAFTVAAHLAPKGVLMH